MAYERLLARIQELWDAVSVREGKKLSERQLCIRAGVGVKSLVSIRDGHAPKPVTLSKLADYFKVSRDYLLSASAMGSPQPQLQPVGTMEAVYVKGMVQAGLWQSAMEWEPTDWYSVQVPASRKYPGYTRYGLEVRGASMDRFYPEGTVILSIKFYELARGPATGDHVVVYIRDPKTGDFEATVKEYECDALGRHILWPRSSAPEFQAPIILGTGELQIAEEDSQEATYVAASFSFDTAGLGDIEVWALVVGSYTER